MGSPAFKAGGTGDPRPAGSIPVHLRQTNPPAGGPGGRRGGRGGRRGRARYAVGMKKLILLVMLVALGVVAAKKVRSA